MMNTHYVTKECGERLWTYVYYIYFFAQCNGVNPEPDVNLFHNDSCSHKNTKALGFNIPDDILLTSISDSCNKIMIIS